MDKLLTMDNTTVTEQPPPPPPAIEEYDQDLFQEFMQQTPVWTYTNRTQENFSSLGEDKTRAFICQY